MLDRTKLWQHVESQFQLGGEADGAFLGGFRTVKLRAPPEEARQSA